MANRRRRGDSPELSAEMLEDAEQAFSMVDPNNSGLMEAKDLKVAMRALGYEPKKDEIKDLVAKYAQDDPESDTGFLVDFGMPVVTLSYNVDETKLRDIFRLAGNVQHVELFKDTDGKSRGRAAIEFEHPVEAVQAISMFNNQELYDRRMRVHMGKMKEEDDRPPRLPEGLKGIGMGLGDNGAPLRDVRSNLPKMTAPPAAPPQAPPPAAGLPPAPAPAAATTPATAALNAVLQTLSAAGGLGALPGTNALQGLLSKLGSGAPGISGPSPDLASQLGLNTQAALNLLQSQLGGQQGAGGAAPPTSLASSVGLRGSGNGLDMNNGAPGVPSLQSSRGRGGTSLTGLAGPPDLPPVSLAGSGPRGAHLPPERNLGVVGGDTVIVRNLPASISWQDLRELFREAGDVKYAEKRTPSEGVVRFSNDREAERAINLFDRTRIQGQAIDVIAFNTRSPFLRKEMDLEFLNGSLVPKGSVKFTYMKG
ncbi:unnamed protein product [Cyprideis torosa]|uniref:Uncharacterized protein n=1 Tax=Cyprideis torosa TaxID=163714 RepID=A0A7R8ZMC9_9CRUS|nr:unnamed protein product [Cyprideis torosa]CAG0884071.1 unnamed protein product [Cyprideis torosa]